MKQRVLVVDDNDINRKVAASMVAQLGHDTDTAVNGEAAVAAVQRGEKFDLILMDCHMPVMDGIEATRCIRAWEQANGRTALPIIAVSASAHQDNRDLCAAAGMDDFIAKPISLAVMRKALEKWLVVTTAAVQRNDAVAVSVLPQALFTQAQFAEMSELLGDKFPELLRRFAEDAQQQLHNLVVAARSADAEALRRCAHKLKGSSGSIGAHALSRLCSKIETQALDQRLQQLGATLDAATACCGQTLQALETYLQQKTGCAAVSR